MGEKKENTPCLRDRNGLTEEEFLATIPVIMPARQWRRIWPFSR